MEVLENHEREISKTYNMLDADGGGQVDTEEFMEGLLALVNGSEVPPRARDGGWSSRGPVEKYCGVMYVTPQRSEVEQQIQRRFLSH